MAETLDVRNMTLGDVESFCHEHWCDECPFKDHWCFFLDRIPGEWHLEENLFCITGVNNNGKTCL